MHTNRLVVLLALALMVSWTRPAAAQQATLGTISFPNSGAAAAQPSFLDGVKLIHSFEWEDAAEAFRKAQEADPGFALAYWGEALSHTGGHHFSPEQDIAAGRKALAKLGSSRADRLAKAPTEREKSYLNAVELLYGEGAAQERARRYAEAMGTLAAQYPDDDEAATLYAIGLMRTERRGAESLRVDMQAGAIAQRIYRKNPDHPGAAHYIIHAFDEPNHAPIALYAADAYAGIAPDAPHALHMPSHIYVQLGMWDKLETSNRASYEASARRSDRKKLKTIEGHAFHALYWLHYAYLMQGHYGKADQTLARVEGYARSVDAGPNRSGQYDAMKARHMIETERWQPIDVTALVEQIRAAPDKVSARVAGATLLAAGLSAFRRNEAAGLELAESGLSGLAASVEQRGRADSLKQVRIMHREVAGLLHLARNQPDAALRLLEEAVEIEESMDAPSGPPGEQETDPPIKPSHELLGEVLLQLDRPAEAARAYEAALLRMPNRNRLVLGAARAAAKQGDRTAAAAFYGQLLKMPGAGPDLPGAKEAKTFTAGTGSATGARQASRPAPAPSPAKPTLPAS